MEVSAIFITYLQLSRGYRGSQKSNRKGLSDHVPSILHGAPVGTGSLCHKNGQYCGYAA
jgi:hypothetical protein